MDLKNILSIVIACLAVLFVSSCTNGYTTYLRNDPFFVQEKPNEELVGNNSLEYVQRENDYNQSNQFSPKPGETYEAFENRMYNTLAVLDQKSQDIHQKIENETHLLNDLNQQQTMLKLKNIDLRMDVASYLNQDRTAKKSDSASSEEIPFSVHEVSQDDTLQKISLENYGTYQGWLTIYRFNAKLLPKGPGIIYPGTKLLIPNISNKL